MNELLSASSDNGGPVESNSTKIREALHLLVHLLEGGAVSALAKLSGPQVLLLSRLLHSLRRELLSPRSRRIASAGELLELLSQLENVSEHLEHAAPHSPLLSTFTAIQGPELMVELAHDIRSPLTSILFLTEALRAGQGGDLTDLQHRHLGIIYTAALTVVSIAGDVIDLARGEHLLLEKESSVFDISEMFRSVFDLVRPIAESKDIELRPRPPENHLRRGFPAAVTRVLLNLATNAIRFTDRGFVELSAIELPGGRLQFSVADSGRGIRRESAEHIFEPFRTRPDRDRIGISGAGLGLTICRRLVHAMGGDLEFESTAGEGTRFYFTLVTPAA